MQGLTILKTSEVAVCYSAQPSTGTLSHEHQFEFEEFVTALLASKATSELPELK